MCRYPTIFRRFGGILGYFGDRHMVPTACFGLQVQPKRMQVDRTVQRPLCGVHHQVLAHHARPPRFDAYGNYGR